jgi:hypothetical protein
MPYGNIICLTFQAMSKCTYMHADGAMKTFFFLFSGRLRKCRSFTASRFVFLLHNRKYYLFFFIELLFLLLSWTVSFVHSNYIFSLPPLTLYFANFLWVFYFLAFFILILLYTFPSTYYLTQFFLYSVLFPFFKTFMGRMPCRRR